MIKEIFLSTSSRLLMLFCLLMKLHLKKWSQSLAV